MGTSVSEMLFRSLGPNGTGFEPPVRTGEIWWEVGSEERLRK